MFSLQKLVERFGPYKEVPSRSDEVRFCCPYCVDIGKLPDRKYHLYINLTKGVGYCFRCGKVLKLNSSWENLRTRNFYLESKVVVNRSVLDVVPQNISIFDSKEGMRFLRYKLSHYPEEYVMDFLREMDVRFCVDSNYPFLFGRIMIPVKFQGEIVGFQFRSIHGEEPKYLLYGYKSFKPKDFVFNYDLASVNSDYVYICEGVFDILPFYRNAVACFGKMLTDSQKRIIANTWSGVYICFDADAVGEAMLLASDLLTNYGLKDVKIVDLYGAKGKDPCDIGFDIYNCKVVDVIERLF